MEELPLVPIPDPLDVQKLASSIREFATERKVSRSMVAYALYRRHRISSPVWRQLHEHFRQGWFEELERRRIHSGSYGPTILATRRS
jgi:hypothetical protein